MIPKESNRYVTMKVKREIRTFIKIEAAKQGFPTMNDYLQNLANQSKEESKVLKKQEPKFKSKRGFNIGF